MTKDEYMEKLMAQFGEDETLIPETKATEETTATEPQETNEEPKEETVEPPEENSKSTKEGEDEGETEKAESEGETADDELVNPENGKKYSNKKIKKTIWENKHLAKEVQELKRQLEEIRKANEPAPKKMKRPSKDQFSSEDEYQDAVFAYNMSLLAEQNKAHTEEQMKAARVIEEKQRMFLDKVNSFIPEDKRGEFEGFMKENYQNLCDTLNMDAQNDIVSMSTTPLILWKLGQSPDLISAVNRMNQVERIMFCDKIADQMKKELAETAPAPQKKAPVVGKVGTGKSASRNMEEMSAEEMYSLMSKRLAGG